MLNPTHEPIDGIVLRQMPHRNKEIPYRAGASYNHGGIVDSVELLITPAVRVEDLFVRADAKTGVIHIQANVRNAGTETVDGEYGIRHCTGRQRRNDRDHPTCSKNCPSATHSSRRRSKSRIRICGT